MDTNHLIKCQYRWPWNRTAFAGNNLGLCKVDFPRKTCENNFCAILSSGSIGYYRRCRAINNSVTLAAAAAPQRLDKQENPQESTSLGELGGICGKRHIFMRSSFLLKFHIWYNKTIWGRIQCWECYQVLSLDPEIGLYFFVCSLFSVCGNVTAWSAPHIVHYWCLTVVANLRGCDSDKRRKHQLDMEGTCLFVSHPQFSFGRVYKLHIPSPYMSPFPALIFFVFVSFVSSAPHTLHYWWPRFVGNIGAGDSSQGGKGHRNLRSNSCCLPPSSCGWTYHCRPNPKFIPVIFTLQRIFDFLNVRFSAVVGDTSSIWLPLHFLSSS